MVSASGAVMRKALIALLIMCAVAIPARVHAAETPVASGISISPFLQKIDITPEDTVREFSISLANNTKVSQEIELSNRDFGSLDETGGLVFAGANEYTEKYGLASWLSLEASSLVLGPGERKDILVRVENRESLGPGGHYGAIVASVADRDERTGNRVSVRQELTSLIFVNKVGGARYDLALASVSRNGSLFALPSSVTLRFQNPGNVHVTPRGTVELRAPDGSVVRKGIINADSAFVLPKTYRQVIIPLDASSGARPASLMNNYRLVVNYRYDGFADTATRSLSVSYVNGIWLLGIGAVLAITAIVFRRWRTRKTALQKAPH